MKLLYEEKNGTIKILRCFGAGNGCGECGTIVLPAVLCDKPVTELGDYLFSAEMREQPRGFLWEESELEMAGAGSLDGSGSAADASRLEKEAGTLCGSEIRTVHLPASLRRIGRYAFYNCDSLRELHFTASIQDIGAGAFNGCRKITDLYVDVIAGEKSCLKEILADLNETLTVHYRELSGYETNMPGDEKGAGEGVQIGEARLLFPLFYEEAVENTPARILETHVHGCGHRYRYCFQGTEFKFRDYDSLFIYARTQEAPEHAAALAMGRLKFPYQLTAEAEREYGEYLMEHLDDAAACLLRDGGMDDLRWFVGYFAPKIKIEHAAAGCLGNEGLAVRAREEYYDIRKPILGETGFDRLVELANRAGHTEATSFLMDARYRSCPPKRKRFTL